MLCAYGKKVTTGKDGKGGDVEIVYMYLGIWSVYRTEEVGNGPSVTEFERCILYLQYFAFFVCERASIPPHISLLREPTVEHNRMIPDDNKLILVIYPFPTFFQLKFALYR